MNLKQAQDLKTGDVVTLTHDDGKKDRITITDSAPGGVTGKLAGGQRWRLEFDAGNSHVVLAKLTRGRR